MSERDCEHGRQLGKCDTCDLIEEQNENDALRAKLQAADDQIDLDTNVVCNMQEQIDKLASENSRLRAENQRLRGVLEQMRGILFEAPHWSHCCEEEAWDEDGSPVTLCDCGLEGLIDIARADLEVGK